MPTENTLDPAFPMDGGDGASRASGRATDAVARGIEAVASTLHGRAESLPGGEKIVRAAHDAADAMEDAADYVRDQDLRAMLADVQNAAKRHPGKTLLVAAALGFLLARLFSRD